jgi:hypothetical protein
VDAEERKHKITEIAGIAVATGLSIVPIVGGPASVAAAYFATMPMQRRTEKILTEIQNDIARLYERDSALDVSMLHSEEFMAALFRTAIAAQESASDSKRKVLRNALLNGYVKSAAPRERDFYLGLATRYEPGHLAILDCMRSLMVGRTTLLDHAVSEIQRTLGDIASDLPVRAYLQDLVNDGLVYEQADREVTEETQPQQQWARSTSRQVVRETRHHSVAPRGNEFLAFIADSHAEDL